jgi:hypothetical protein
VTTQINLLDAIFVVAGYADPGCHNYRGIEGQPCHLVPFD